MNTLSKDDRDLVENITPEEILSPEALLKLSTKAVRLYAGLWRLMAERRSTSIRIPDETASRRGKILMSDLQAAKDELSRAGLVRIVPIEGTPVSTYDYVEQV